MYQSIYAQTRKAEEKKMEIFNVHAECFINSVATIMCLCVVYLNDRRRRRLSEPFFSSSYLSRAVSFRKTFFLSSSSSLVANENCNTPFRCACQVRIPTISIPVPTPPPLLLPLPPLSIFLIIFIVLNETNRVWC